MLEPETALLHPQSITPAAWLQGAGRPAALGAAGPFRFPAAVGDTGNYGIISRIPSPPPALVQRRARSKRGGSMQSVPEPIARLIGEFSRLPGIGPKSASRLTFYLLR